MFFIGKIFAKKTRKNAPIVPSWSEIVEMMYGKSLDLFSEEVVNVIYSADKSMRYVVLKDRRGLLTYLLEALYPYDDDIDWASVNINGGVLPAEWEPVRRETGKSFFDDEAELMKAIKFEPEYRRYFQ